MLGIKGYGLTKLPESLLQTFERFSEPHIPISLLANQFIACNRLYPFNPTSHVSKVRRKPS